MGFIAQCYEEKNGELVFNGSQFENGMVGDTMPSVGDTVIIPITKKRDDPHFTERDVFEIRRRIIELDPNGGPAIVKFVVSREPRPVLVGG
jgi:hypothetical protein